MFRASLLVFGSVLASAASAGPLAYVTGYLGDFQIIDMSSPVTTYVKNIGFVANGLAATNNGNIYASDSIGMIWDITGPNNIPVGPVPAAVIGALDSDGVDLWGYDNATDRMFKFDVGMGSVTAWSPTLGFGGSLNAMAIDGNGDFLVVSQDNTNQFDRIDASTWAVTNISPNLGLPDKVMGIDFLSDGNLYATVFSDYRYQVNPLNGQSTGFYAGIHRDFGAMTMVPVPEPGSIALLAGGLGLLARRRRLSR